MVAASKPLVEKFGSLNLQLGGTNGYVGVRKCKKGGYQGYTPKKSKGHFTGRYDTAQEAAVARAIKQQEIALGFNCDSGEKPRRQRAKAAAAPWLHVHASRARLSLSFVESCLRKKPRLSPSRKRSTSRRLSTRRSRASRRFAQPLASPRRRWDRSCRRGF